MHNQHHNRTFGSLLLRVVLVLAVFTTALITASIPSNAPVAEAQGQDLERKRIWARGQNGAVQDPKIWKLLQVDNAADDIGTARAADPDLDDSDWTDTDVFEGWREITGSNVANHWRKDFTFDEIDVDPFQVVGIDVGFRYDDAAVLYLNGVEVYRTIRGNLDPQYELYPEGSDLPYNVDIPFGGCEACYVQIPDPDGENDCEELPGCTNSPYGGPQPPAVPLSLLNPDGVNTWAATTWNQSGGGSGDSQFDHTFHLILDRESDPNPIFINEVMASNDGVQLDNDAELEEFDWFELHNRSNFDVNMRNWEIADSAANWVFPNVTIPAGGYLVVAANDEDTAEADPLLATNFKISSEGDSLTLTNAEGIVVDEFAAMPQQFTNGTYGRANDVGAPTYLDTYTPGAANSAAGQDYDPIVRLFASRLYNEGETVQHQINAFDPDGSNLTYSMDPLPPGLNVDGDGLITGTMDEPGFYRSTLVVTDAEGNQSEPQNVTWRVFESITEPPPLLLNEYNAVASGEELRGGSEPGNGGDWFEFIVMEDQLDLRGYSFELFDRKGTDGQLRRASIVTFSDDPRLARAPAGTFITLSQEMPDDLSFNADGDWRINFQLTPDATGEFFDQSNANAVFNSTRTGQTVMIKNSEGELVAPLSGETDAWDSANGNVSSSEVMSLCVQPTPGLIVNPVTDYSDNGRVSTFGLRNICIFPVEGGGETRITQRLNQLRATATLGAGSGDVNCDLQLDLADALLGAQYAVGSRVDSGPCFFDLGGADHDVYAGAADLSGDGQVDLGDALLLARCAVGVILPECG